jgi:hypothetical protein
MGTREGYWVAIPGLVKERGEIMATDPIETDYLVVGAGATAMAFKDTLLNETDAQIVVVDRQHHPGGHWNHAYPFVRLHQPSAIFGGDSRELSDWTKDKSGMNAGMYSLASGAEVLAYFDHVMQQRFQASGRVRWQPMSDYSLAACGTHCVKSRTSGEVRQVMIRKKLVDAIHARTEVLAPHPTEAPRVERGDLCPCQSAARDHAAIHGPYGGVLGQDRNGCLRVAARERYAALSDRQDHAARCLVA